jgi:hypothetical protein
MLYARWQDVVCKVAGCNKYGGMLQNLFLIFLNYNKAFVHLYKEKIKFRSR